ncbi:uncharacterized protein LOC127831799 [Dreissena polymorpha]|uniref:uncharacterized protein LOC127831799 n=1 Tax=Dreissena polymorpha TaxID=45954 RepID=UPI0022650047|nr:uncharacterized protein LOC127831799 [Dreissena polymorpha]
MLRGKTNLYPQPFTCFLFICRCVVRLRLIGAARVKLARETELEAKSDQESAEQNATIRNKMRNLGQQSWAQYLCIVENLADLINAINWMPQGFLFGGQFSSKFTGAMGTISSLLKLYRLHASKKAS